MATISGCPCVNRWKSGDNDGARECSSVFPQEDVYTSALSWQHQLFVAEIKFMTPGYSVKKKVSPSSGGA